MLKVDVQKLPILQPSGNQRQTDRPTSPPGAVDTVRDALHADVGRDTGTAQVSRLIWICLVELATVN